MLARLEAHVFRQLLSVVFLPPIPWASHSSDTTSSTGSVPLRTGHFLASESADLLRCPAEDVSRETSCKAPYHRRATNSVEPTVHYPGSLQSYPGLHPSGGAGLRRKLGWMIESSASAPAGTRRRLNREGKCHQTSEPLRPAGGAACRGGPRRPRRDLLLSRMAGKTQRIHRYPASFPLLRPMCRGDRFD